MEEPLGENDDRWKVSFDGVTLLGRYKVERQMGSGGMATVYLARDQQLGLDVVVKVPHPAFLSDPTFRTRFHQETEGLIALQHPHIVKIHARGEHEGLPFLVMQYLGGGSLGDRMRRGAIETLDLDDVMRWLPGIADALDFIHRQGIVHRDIKPDNVLFDDHGYVYLSDFGIAKAVGADDTGLTATGATPGSPAYMAPEQVRTNELDGKSDQYALAASLYEVLAGKPAYDGETVMAVLVQKQSEDPTPIREHAPDLPLPAANAIMRALARNPADRFPSCAAFVAALRAPEPAPAPKPAPVPVPSPAGAPAAAPRAAASRRPPPRADTVPQARTHAAATTFTFSSSRKTIFALLLLVAIGVPLAWILRPSSEDGEDASGRIEVAREEAADEAARLEADAKAAEAREAEAKEAEAKEAAAPEAGAIPPPTREMQLAGRYSLDADALKARLDRIQKTRAPMGGKRPPPMLLRELKRILDSGFHLRIEGDQRFILTLAPDTNRTKVVHGSWKEEGDLLVFTPDEVDEREGREFKVRVVPGGLLLLRANQEIRLARD